MARPESRSPRIPFRPVNGIVLLDKPQGMSSNRALQAVRRLFRAAKGGHTGSLDPMATGLLPLCFGEATKIAGLLLGSRKAYDAECRLGVTTDTDDAEGEALACHEVPVLDAETVQTALRPFVGRIRQVPPAYSALKRDGVPMYRRARRGETVELPAREVQVDAIDVLSVQRDTVRLRVTCGSGTYIRALARDLGAELGCGAHLTALRRLWVEPFIEPAMYTLEELEGRAAQGDQALMACLLPVDAGLAWMGALYLPEASAHALERGQAVRVADGVSPGLYRVHAEAGGRLLALAECKADGLLRTRRGFNLES